MKKSLIIFLLFIFQCSMAQEIPYSTASFFVLRLKPHQDLKQELLAFAKANGLKAACIVTGVGSLEQFHLRYANQNEGAIQKGHFEIVSMTGTLSDSSSHLHLSVSDSTGRTIGGHVLDQNLIYTTAEIVIAEMDELEFKRAKDAAYGYQELAVQQRKRKKAKQ